MAAVTNGHTNGVNGHAEEPEAQTAFQRFSDIPPAMDIPVSNADAEEEAVEVDLEDLMDDPTELCTLLENENVAKNYWMTIALAYAKQQKLDLAIDILNRGLGSLSRAKSEDRLSLLACICWVRLWQCREAPRLKPEGEPDSDIRLKDHYIQAATTTLNEASRISPTYPPLFLARGVLYLLRASLHPTKAGTTVRANNERIDFLQQATKCFDDALRSSRGRNVMATMGKARALFSLGKHAEALSNYQTALANAPDLRDPDPRIGIGCCFWQLGYKDDANTAWVRALEVNPDSKMANVLLGLYHLDQSSQYQTSDQEFQTHYKKAMTQFTQTAWKMDNKYPLTCATFGNYFLLRKAWSTVEKLARQAIESTDVNAIASDGWYLMARKEHYQDNVAAATDYYNRADQARGGEDKGYLPAKFGAAQLKVLTRDLAGAKFRLEKIVQTRNIEAMTLLGIIYAEEYFVEQAAGSKEDKSAEMKKAIAYLEQVRSAWKDPKRKVTPDSNVLLNLARLYEVDFPERSLQCLQQVEQMELSEIPDEDKPEEKDPEALNALLRELLPPQLLNNMASFHFQAERYTQARELFQTALNACVKAGDKDSETDTDSLVTTISFNLARTYEAEGMLDEARKVYDGLLERHPSYIDARIRLAYILLQQEPAGAGPKAVKELLEAEPTNMDVRALYGWFLHRSKKRTQNLAEDQEQRHYKHTLMQQDKHDKYSLTGMGNLHLQVAREMPRNTEQEKDRRSKTYQKAIEFFDKALQLDKQNAYAAQGIAIALCEDKKDYSTAIQVFTKVREAIKDSSVHLNLGHVFVEVKQYARAIECYETALARDRSNDPQILACLGRVLYFRGKQEKSISILRSALDFAQSTVEASPDSPLYKWNVPFLQAQIASLILTLPETSRTLADVEAASDGLNAAIESFDALAQQPNPPFPKHDIEQRANMSRNTMRKQLDRALQSQREYEDKNAAKLSQARAQREAEIAKREEAKRAAEEEAEAQRRRLREEREKMMEEDRRIAEQKASEDRIREEAEYTTDEETGERRKREKKKASKRKKKTEDTDDEDGDAGFGSDGSAGEKRKSRRRKSSATPVSGDEVEAAGPKKKKRRKLERKGKPAAASNGKFKSDERIVDSDDDDELFGDEEAAPAEDAVDGEAATKKKRPTRVLDEDDEDEDGDGDGDVSMVDERAPAAGNEDAADS